jgi:hypothetical protein
MKFSVVSFLAVFLIANFFANPTIAQVDIGPDDIPVEAGSIFPFYVSADSEGIEIDLGNSGEDREWDFTLYEFTDVVYDSLISLEDAPYAEDFEGANRVSNASTGGIAINLGDSYQYEMINDDGWFLLGMGFGVGGIGFPIVFPEPILLLPMPADYNEDWDMSNSFAYGMVAPDTLLGGILDSVYIVVEVGGQAETDAWGTVRFPSGEIETMRQHVLLGIEIIVVGIANIFGQRVEIPIDLGLNVELTHSYRWFAEDHGLLVEVNSLPGEEDEDFELAASIRVRYVAPNLVFQEGPLEFGEVWEGGSNRESLTFSNNGGDEGRIMRIEPAEDFAEQISWDIELPFTINPNDSAEINFRWHPTEFGELESEIEIFHNDPAVENPFVLAITCTSLLGISDDKNLMPQEFSLYQNFPNPFNSTTKINYGLPTDSYVTLDVYNLSGQVVNSLYKGYKQAGFHSTFMLANNLTSGLYFIRLNASDQIFTQKVMLIR